MTGKSLHTDKPLYSQVVCIGAGISGLCLAAQLQRQLGVTDVHLYDRNPSISGTWWANRYPGCACDIPAHFYSFSFDLNPNWSRASSPAPEIRAYLEAFIDKHNIRRKTTVSTEVERAVYHERSHQWTVYLKDLNTGRTYTHNCTILVSAVGGLSTPKLPVLPGLETFEGDVWHTAQYREDVDISGKDVVVLGNGCTASQLIPSIISETKSITQVGRSPHWYLPGFDFAYPAAAKWAFRWIPGLMRLHRAQLWLGTESGEPMFYYTDKGADLRNKIRQESLNYIHMEAPERYHEILTPKFEMGCKRRIFDNLHYVRTLNEPKMHLTASPVTAVLSHGIRTADGKEYPADAIICATGFNAIRTLDKIDIHGRGGRTLKTHWDEMGGPEAYNTTAVHGFPNFFMIFGPNSATGYTSVLMTSENIVSHILTMIKPIIRGDAAEVEVKDEAERQFSAETQAALKDRIYVQCSSWYVDPSGWNAAVYPWSQRQLWWRCVFPTWRDWDIKYVKPRWARSSTKKPALWALIGVAAAVGLYGNRTNAAWWVLLVSELQTRLSTLVGSLKAITA